MRAEPHYCIKLCFVRFCRSILIFLELQLLLISAVTIRAAGCQCIFPDEIRSAAQFTHRIIQMAHCGNQVIKTIFLHKGAYAACIKSCLMIHRLIHPFAIYLPQFRLFSQFVALNKHKFFLSKQKIHYIYMRNAIPGKIQSVHRQYILG